MAMRPQEQLPEDQMVPPGSTPDNGNVEAEEQLASEEVQQEVPEEVSPDAGELTPEPTAEKEADDDQGFDPDPEFAKKFSDGRGRIDWKKAHDAYLAAERKISEPRRPSQEEEDLQRKAKFGEYAAFLYQKYPSLSLQAANEREQMEQMRAQRSAQGQAVIPDAEDLSDEEVDERVNNLIAEGKHAQATRLAARYTPESRSVREQEKRQAIRERQEVERQVREKQEQYRSDIAKISTTYGEQSPEVWAEMNRALSKVPHDFEVDVDDLFHLAKAKVEKAAATKPKPVAPPGRSPRPGAQPVKPVRKESPFGQSDEDYLSSRREVSINDVLGKK